MEKNEFIKNFEKYIRIYLAKKSYNFNLTEIKFTGADLESSLKVEGTTVYKNKLIKIFIALEDYKRFIIAGFEGKDAPYWLLDKELKTPSIKVGNSLKPDPSKQTEIELLRAAYLFHLAISEAYKVLEGKRTHNVHIYKYSNRIDSVVDVFLNYNKYNLMSDTSTEELRKTIEIVYII